MIHLACERHRVRHHRDSSVNLAHLPPHYRGGDASYYARARSKPEARRTMSLWVVELYRLVHVFQRHREVSQIGGSRQEVAFDQDQLIVFLLGQFEQLPSHLRCFLPIRGECVVTSQRTEHREPM